MLLRVDKRLLRVEKMLLRVDKRLLRVEKMPLRVEKRLLRVEKMPLRVDKKPSLEAPGFQEGSKATQLPVTCKG